MKLNEEIILNILKKENVHITFSNSNLSTKEIVELKCYETLQKIKAIIEDDSLEDKECFMKIEQIICMFEKLGSNGGNRHDFG